MLIKTKMTNFYYFTLREHIREFILTFIESHTGFALQINVGELVRPAILTPLCHMFLPFCLVCKEFSAVSTIFIFNCTFVLQLSHRWWFFFIFLDCPTILGVHYVKTSWFNWKLFVNDINSRLKDSFNLIFIRIVRIGSKKLLIIQDITEITACNKYWKLNIL